MIYTEFLQTKINRKRRHTVQSVCRSPQKGGVYMAIALYARKSIERENSISCETQIEYCKAMIKPNERSEKVITFIDNGYSGGNTDREGFQKMMRNIENGKISKVIVYRLDRISRSLFDFVNILNTFREHNVEFVSSQEAFDTSSPYGDLIVKILAVFAEFERNSIIARVTQAYEHRSEMGFYMGGRKPYGFTLEPVTINNVNTKRLAPQKDEIEQVKYIYEMYAVENVTLGRLLKNLINNNIKPVSGGGWTTAKLSTILKNPIYVKADNSVYDYFQRNNTQIISSPESFDGIHGLQLYGRSKHNSASNDWSDIKAVIMTHEGIIDSEIWIKCQYKLVKNKQVRNAVSNKSSWLGGKIICEKCGRTMTTIKGKTGGGKIRIYFNCTGKSHFKDCTGSKSTIYAESLEDMIYKEIGKKLDTLKDTGRQKNNNISPMLNELKNKLKSIELEEAKLAEIIIKNEINSDLITILNNKACKLKSDKTDILAKIDDIKNKEIDTKSVINLSKKWKTASFEEKRGVCNILINKIIIDYEGNAEIIWNI